MAAEVNEGNKETNMGDIKMVFGKSRVRPHVRQTRSGKQIAVGSYNTRRPPGKERLHVIYNMGQLADTTSSLVMRSKAAPCHHYKRSSGRKECPCEPCRVWRAIKDRKDYHAKTMFQKAVSRVNEFLKAHWEKAASLFKGGQEMQRADETLGASEAPPVELAEDLASARDLGPETDPVTVGGEDLPWAAEDHASAPANTETSEAEIEQIETSQDDSPLAKAKRLQKSLQAEIVALDEQLLGEMDDEARNILVEHHLNYLIKAEALSGHISMAESLLDKR